MSSRQINFVYSGKEELYVMEGMINYNKRIINIIKRFMENEQSIADFGAGIGTLAAHFPKQNLICIEKDRTQMQLLQSKGFTVCESLNDIADNSLSFLYSSNVLEHIEDDYQTVKKIYKKLRPNGRIVFYVPAFPFLYSEMDKRVGHFRRYTKNRLCDVFSKANFKIERVFYSDSLGFFATLVFKVLTPKISHITLKKLCLFDKICPVSTLFDKLLFSRFFGKNIIIVSRKITHTDDPA